MKDAIKLTLMPLYGQLLKQITIPKDVYSFCIQWGKNFPTENNTGILFVGKATNGWVTNSRDVEVLFGDTKDRIFNRWDQMKWVHDLEKDKGYNTLKSAFWRVIKRTTQSVYGKEDWYSKIAWSNLYKVSYITGNPDAALKKEQIEICKKILQEEINILSPKYVVFLTSGWENTFVSHLTKDTQHKWDTLYKWDKKYEVKICLVDDRIFMCSQHPQGKSEYHHAKVIADIINGVA